MEVPDHKKLWVYNLNIGIYVHWELILKVFQLSVQILNGGSKHTLWAGIRQTKHHTHSTGCVEV